jgi:glycosyltransferase involved in cell wall biosynthesis
LTRLDPSIDAVTVPIAVSDEFFDANDQVVGDDSTKHIIVSGVLGIDAVAKGVVEFLQQVWPGVRQAVHGVRLSVWSRTLPPEVRRLLARAPDADYVGWVDDYRGFLRTASVYVYPQRTGAGIQTKVQQAMAMGIPVVTRQHILDAVGADNGIQAIACEEDRTMTEAIVALLHDATLRVRIGRAAAKQMYDGYRLDVVGDKLARVYEAAIAKHGPDRMIGWPNQ